jgi:acyl-CoA synthetase (AMP-forming)/AMP-acid ligase II
LNIADAFSRRAAVDGTRIAAIEPETRRTLSFAELDRRACALAAAFQARGLTPGTIVAVLARNRIEYLEIYLACAKSGCVAQGLNWRFALPSMLGSLREVQPSLVIVEQRFAAAAAALREDYAAAAWCFFGEDSDGSYEDLLSSGDGKPFTAAEGDDAPLMVLHTGGTTGDSKGAVHSHNTLWTAMANNTIAERIVPTDRYLLIGQAFHSAAVLALNYLRHGCAVVILNFEPRLALEVIEEWGVTCFLGFPTMMTYMLEEGASSRFDLSGLRNIQYGGGSFAQSTILGFLETFPCRLIQCYGTTESIGITFLTQEDHDRARERPELLRSCGPAAFMTEIKLSDAAPAPEFGDHEVGELLVRSRSNMLGYWSRGPAGIELSCPEWLPTGDLGYIDRYGYLHLVGRSKDVIISGGENIYATQVENAIHKHPDVIEVAVIGVPDELWGEAVKAVVVLRGGSRVTTGDIERWVAGELASYQKPKHVEFIDALPRTPTGKVLKRALS